MTDREVFTFPFEDLELEAVLDRPDGAPRCAFLFAHGSGAGKDSDFMTDLGVRLAKEGYAVMRFDYPYMQRARELGKRRPPDRRPTLEKSHRRALEELIERVPDTRILLGGKSLGGRMSSYLVAEDNDLGRAAGLVFFGYPLHPKQKPEKLRTEHFPILAVPTLFLQGTRDELCSLDLLQASLATFGGAVTLEVIDAADHSFDVLKRSGRTSEEVRSQLVEAFVQWERSTFPA